MQNGKRKKKDCNKILLVLVSLKKRFILHKSNRVWSTEKNDLKHIGMADVITCVASGEQRISSDIRPRIISLVLQQVMAHVIPMKLSPKYENQEL